VVDNFRLNSVSSWCASNFVTPSYSAYNIVIALLTRLLKPSNRKKNITLNLSVAHITWKKYCKTKFSLCLTNEVLRNEDVWGSGGIDPRFLDLGTSWRWVVSFTPRPLYPGQSAPGTNWIGGWENPRTGLDIMEKWTFLPPPGLEPQILRHPALINSLHPLLYSGYSYYINIWMKWYTVHRFHIFFFSFSVSA
jgi:hypothetical protein